MRTTRSPKTGITWQLCGWNEACQMPVSSCLEDKLKFCPWHQRCLAYPEQAHQFEAFTMYLDWFQRAYPSCGWWGWTAVQLWPVLQGVSTIWQAEQEAA